MKKTPPDIHPRNKCTKFQPNSTIFGLSRLPQSFMCTHRKTDRHCQILAQLKLRIVPEAQWNQTFFFYFQLFIIKLVLLKN